MVMDLKMNSVKIEEKNTCKDTRHVGPTLNNSNTNDIHISPASNRSHLHDGLCPSYPAKNV